MVDERFSCNNCQQQFNLRTDAERHENQCNIQTIIDLTEPDIKFIKTTTLKTIITKTMTALEYQGVINKQQAEIITKTLKTELKK